MIEIILLSSLTFFTFYYVYFITKVRVGLFSLDRPIKSELIPFISVVIAARNEENNIAHCIESLFKQTYPKDKYEIIIIDDRSIDNTVEIARSLQKHFNNLKIYSVNEFDNKRNSGKINAINLGVQKAKGEIILTTDADCFAPSRWIEIMSYYFSEDVVFVAGPVAEKTNSFLSKLEQLELLGLITTAAGLIGANRPIICNGANLGYKKDAFFAVSGFSENNVNNDDELLMNKIVHRKIGRVTFAIEPDAVILTKSANSIGSFLLQRIRWANKRGHYEDKSILVTLVFLYLFFLNLFIVAILLPSNTQLILPFSLAFLGKIVIDYLTLRAGSKRLKQSFSTIHFLIAEILHVPYVVIAAAIGQFMSLRWKGRKIN